MPGAKVQSAGVAATQKRRRRGKRNADSGAFAIKPAASPGITAIAIPVEGKIAKALSRKTRLVGHLIETYGAAIERSRRTGLPVRFTVDVEPQGAPKITPVEVVRDAEPVLARPSAPGSGPDRVLAAARERGRHRIAEILSGPEMLSADQFAELIGVSRVTVNSKRQARQVLGLEGAKRGYRFPEWQVGEDGRPSETLPELFELLGDSPWSVYRFLVQYHPELDGLTGREALRRGRTEAVLKTAESIARGDFA